MFELEMFELDFELIVVAFERWEMFECLNWKCLN